jgi:hypothetical protein
MYPEFNAQSHESFAGRNKINNRHMIPNQHLAAGGFNNWWQKTSAQNMATVSEARDLIREHRLVSSDVQENTAFALNAKQT